MSFPGTESPIMEWLIDGVWTNLSDRTRWALDIARGRQNEQGSISPGTLLTTLDNRDGVMSNRNPRSAYYRKIPTGTQVRVRAGDSAGADNYASFPYNTFNSTDAGRVMTSDKAALDIVGDIEIRMDVQPHTWRPADRYMILASKFTTIGNQRSWVVYLSPAGRLSLSWSADGTNMITSNATAAIPAITGRLSIKVTLDVNNGAAGNTVAFYTATSIGGTYTQLGTSVITAGITSIFAGTAQLALGAGETNAAIYNNGVGFGGRYYGLQLYNGIAGSRVANPDFSTWTLDSTAVADSHANTWTVSGQARIGSPRVRFWGELSSMTQVSDKSGRDDYVPMQAADITQRLSTARQPTQSPLYLNVSQKSDLLGYWPLEDGPDSDFAASAIVGGQGAVPFNISFGQSAGLPGASQEAELTAQTSKIIFRIPKGTNTNEWQAVWLFKMPDTLPATDSNFLQFTTNGLARYVSFTVAPSTWSLRFNDSTWANLQISSTTFGTGVVVAGEWIAMRLQMSTSGGNVNWEWAWYQQGSSTFWGTSGSFAGTSVGAPSQAIVSAAANSAFAGTKFSHFVVSEGDLGFASGDTSWSAAIDAYAGETAAARIARVASDAGIYCEVSGEVSSSVLMGPQPVDTAYNVMQDAARADGGLLYGLRDAYGLKYRTRQDLERHLDAALTYATHLSEVPESTDDDQSVINAFTASRIGGSSDLLSGSSVYVEITDGYNSSADPPTGIGYRPAAGDFNVYTDSQLQGIADLRAHAGSYDQPRIPNLAVALHRAATLPTTTAGAQAMGLDIGSTVSVTSWPDHLPPDVLYFLAQGYRETITHFLWDVRINTTPAGFMRTGTYGTVDQAAGATRYGSRSSTLSAGITSTATTIILAGTAGVTTVEVWTSTSARYPIDIMVGGERMTLTQAPTGSTSPQTFNNVTRSVNGIVKSHAIGERAQLFAVTHYGLES